MPERNYEKKWANEEQVLPVLSTFTSVSFSSGSAAVNSSAESRLRSLTLTDGGDLLLLISTDNAVPQPKIYMN